MGMLYTRIKGKADLEKAIEAAILVASSARENLQNVLVSLQAHYLEHGDYTLLSDFVVKVDELKGYNARGMIQHCEKYIGLKRNPVVVDATAGKTQLPKGFNGHSGYHSKTEAEKVLFLEAAEANFWWDAAKIKSAFKDLDMDAILLRALDKIEKREKAIKDAIPTGVDADIFVKKHVKPVSQNTRKKLLALINFEADILPGGEAANTETATVPETLVANG